MDSLSVDERVFKSELVEIELVRIEFLGTELVMNEAVEIGESKVSFERTRYGLVRLEEFIIEAVDEVLEIEGQCHVGLVKLHGGPTMAVLSRLAVLSIFTVLFMLHVGAAGSLLESARAFHNSPMEAKNVCLLS